MNCGLENIGITPSDHQCQPLFHFVQNVTSLLVVCDLWLFNSQD